MPHAGSGGFQVAALSPASLLNQGNDRGPLDQIFNQALNFAFQQRLLESSQSRSVEAEEVRQAGAREGVHEGRLAFRELPILGTQRHETQTHRKMKRGRC